MNAHIAALLAPWAKVPACVEARSRSRGMADAPVADDTSVGQDWWWGSTEQIGWIDCEAPEGPVLDPSTFTPEENLAWRLWGEDLYRQAMRAYRRAWAAKTAGVVYGDPIFFD